jgi:hypothetical protein
MYFIGNVLLSGVSSDALDYCFKREHKRFLPHPFQFIIHTITATSDATKYVAM